MSLKGFLSKCFVALLCTYAAHQALPLLLRHVKYSIYYTPDLQRIHDIERWRRSQAEELAASYNGDRVVNNHIDKSPICIVVTTTRRARSYLLECVTSVLRSLDTDSTLVVYNGDISYQDTPESDLYKVKQMGVEVIQANKDTHECCEPGSCSDFSKETLDYTTGLEQCIRKINSGYVVVLQDDSYATSDFSWKLRNLAEKMSLTSLRNGEDTSWAVVKVFVTSFWSGWSGRTSDVLSIVGFGFGMALVFLVAVHVYTRRRQGKWSRWQRFFTLAGCVYIWVVSSIMIGVVNKQNTPFHPWFFRGLHELDTEDVASAVGNMYSYTKAVALAKFLKANAKSHVSTHKDWINRRIVPVDILIGDFAKELNLRSGVVIPNLVEHIGVHTSIMTKYRGRTNLDEKLLYKNIYKTSTWFETDYKY